MPHTLVDGVARVAPGSLHSCLSGALCLTRARASRVVLRSRQHGERNFEALVLTGERQRSRREICTGKVKEGVFVGHKRSQVFVSGMLDLTVLKFDTLSHCTPPSLR